MKICYLFTNLHLAEYTGQAGIIYRIAQNMADQGAQVSIVSNSTEDNSYRYNDIRFHIIKGNGDIFPFAINFFNIYRFIRQYKPDIIHVHGGLFNIYALVIARLLGIKCVASVCETLSIHHPHWRLILISCLRFMHKTIVTSCYIQEQFIKRGFPENRLMLIRTGLGSVFRKNIPKPLEQEDVDILYIGDSTQERGFNYIFRLAETMTDTSFLLLIRWETQDCATTCAPKLNQMKSFKNVRIIFYPYEEPVYRLMQRAKIAVLPFQFMHMRPPLTIIELMALGKCIITTKMEGNEEIIQHGITGFTLDFSNYFPTVISTIKQLLESNEHRMKIGNGARQFIQKKYPESEYANLYQTYQNLLT